MGDAKKAAAALSAVVQYIKTEEEAISVQSALQAREPAIPLISQAPAPVSKPWGLSGRQAQMQMRNLMQLRTFRNMD
jgi:hypothetical protein